MWRLARRLARRTVGARLHRLRADGRDVARARTALQALPLQPRFIHADMRHAALPACDLVVVLDVLHYVDHAAQQAVLAGVRDALQASQGRLLLRIGDAGSRRGFAVSQWVDRAVTMARGHRVAPTFGRPLRPGSPCSKRWASPCARCR